MKIRTYFGQRFVNIIVNFRKAEYSLLFNQLTYDFAVFRKWEEGKQKRVVFGKER